MSRVDARPAKRPAATRTSAERGRRPPTTGTGTGNVAAPDPPDRAAAALAVAVVAVGIATRIANGNYHPFGLLLVVFATFAASMAFLRPSFLRGQVSGRFFGGLLLAGLAAHAIGLISLTLIPVGGDIEPVARSVCATGLCGCFVAAACCIPCLTRPADATRGWPATLASTARWLLIASHLLAGCAAVRAAASPPVDVVFFQQLSVAELLDGHNPYATTFPDLSNGTSAYYGPGLQADGKLLFGYPYLPLSLLSIVPMTVVTADFRYTQALAFTLAGACIAWTGRRRGTPTALATLVAALFLTTPTGPFVVASGWTEPLLAAALGLVVLAAVRKPAATPLALGVFWAMKQYVPLTAPLAGWVAARSGRGGRRRPFVGMAVAAGIAAAVTLPLALWDLGAFWHSAVAVQLLQPFRPDALSLAAWLHRVTDVAPPSWLAFVGLAVVELLAWWRGPRSIRGYTESLAAALLVFFVLSKQAFANYYFLAIAALASALVVAIAGPPESESDRAGGSAAASAGPGKTGPGPAGTSPAGPSPAGPQLD